MTCDKDAFYLYRRLRATEGADKSETLTRDWREVIPRGLL